MRAYPTIEITADPDRDPELLGLLLAEIDDDQPLGTEGVWSGYRISFLEPASRDRALEKLRARWPALDCVATDVSDEDWAARSQANLMSVVVGEYTVSPPWDLPTDPFAPYVVIQPSMGFGTGHHASTRLCMRLMLTLPEIHGRSVLDIGTGSGLLAVVAAKQGAGRVVAIDIDPDALQSAHENIDLNELTGRIDVRLADFTDATTFAGERFDLVVANLTGAMIAREASRLRDLTASSGRLIVSGLQDDEIDDVRAGLVAAGWHVVTSVGEEGWAGMLLRSTQS